jgi:ribosome-binding protein aMBF1 (putative translation factor)
VPTICEELISPAGAASRDHNQIVVNAKQIERARRKAGLSQRQLAERAQVSQAFVASVERGFVPKRPERSWAWRMVLLTLGLEP